MKIYIDKTCDIQQLIGTYICAEQIGQFKWKDGPLLLALRKGLTLVIENFNEINQEILNCLIEISEGNYNLIKNQIFFDENNVNL